MEVLVYRGFLVYAQNTDTVDYVQQAYALALSIKYSQIEIKNISIVTNDSIPENYKSVFDQIIPIPYFNDTVNSFLKTEHRYQLYSATPYEETIVLDSDMLVLEDLTSWWNYCSNYDVKFCNKILNYKLEYVLEDTVHRQAFIANKLSSPYYALHYFKKSNFAKDFYKVLEFVCNNWEQCWTIFAPEKYQDWPSMDLATAIAIEITGSHEHIFDVNNPMEFVHMKSPIQGWETAPEKWSDNVSTIITSKGQLLVGNIKQPRVFHYVDKDFLTESMLLKLEELSNGS
jgi:hypothetical protein